MYALTALNLTRGFLETRISFPMKYIFGSYILKRNLFFRLPESIPDRRSYYIADALMMLDSTEFYGCNDGTAYNHI